GSQLVGADWYPCVRVPVTQPERPGLGRGGGATVVHLDGDVNDRRRRDTGRNRVGQVTQVPAGELNVSVPVVGGAGQVLHGEAKLWLSGREKPGGGGERAGRKSASNRRSGGSRTGWTARLHWRCGGRRGRSARSRRAVEGSGRLRLTELRGRPG